MHYALIVWRDKTKIFFINIKVFDSYWIYGFKSTKSGLKIPDACDQVF